MFPPDDAQILACVGTTMAAVHELGSPLLGPEKFSSDEADLVSAPATYVRHCNITVLGFWCMHNALCGYNTIQESLPLEEVFEQLNTSRTGLSSSDAAERLQLFGANRLQEKRVSSPFFMPVNWIVNSYLFFP